jgi:Ras-related GTP-binding protein C/D
VEHPLCNNLILTCARYLALVCIMGQEHPAEKKAIIDYNVGVFQAGLKQVFPKSDREAQIEVRATNDT